MKLVFRDVQSTRDLIYEASYYHLELSEILQELQQKYPQLQGRLLHISYAGHLLEPFWTLNYLIEHFQLKEFDILQLQKEEILPLNEIQTLDDLLEVKEDVLAMALKEIPFDLIQESFGDLSRMVQAKILKNMSGAHQELLEATKPSLRPGDSFSLLQAFIFQGEQLASREKEEKATQKLKKLLRKKDVFFSSSINSEEIAEEESASSSSIDETISKLSSQIFETQKEIQNQEDREQHLFTQIQKNTSTQKEFLESLLQEEEPTEKTETKLAFEPIPSEENATGVESKVVDQLFEDKNLQETLPTFPTESSDQEERNSPVPSKTMDHLFEDLELPANTPTGHHIEEFFQEKIPEETLLEPSSKHEVVSPPKIPSPLPEKKESRPKPPAPEKQDQLQESKEYILSKQQLLAAGYALHRPPPLRKQKLIASPDDSDATLPVQNVPRISYLQAKEKKEKAPDSQSFESPTKYHLSFDLSFPQRWPCFHPFPVHSDIDARCIEGIHSYEVVGEMELDIPGTYLADPIVSFQAEKKLHVFSGMELKREKISGKLIIRWNQKVIGEFPIEIDFFASPRKIPYWTLPLAGLFGSLGSLLLPYGMLALMLLTWIYMFFVWDKNASRKDPYQTFHFDLYASI